MSTNQFAQKPTVTKNYLWSGSASVQYLFGAPGWQHKEAEGNKPEHWHVRIEGVDVHLRDGLTPEDLGNAVRVEIKYRTAQSSKGAAQYVYVNVYPASVKTAPRYKLVPFETEDGAYQVFKCDHGGAVTLLNIK